MSKILKGFVSIDSLQSYTPGVISPIGELSIWSLTYTKDKTEFSDATIPGYRLVETSYYDTADGVRIEPSSSIVKEILSVVKSVFTYANTNALPYNLSDFLSSITATYLGKIQGFSMGPMVGVNGIQMPQWIEYQSLTTSDLSVRVWLADEAFAGQYDLYDIVVVPPIDNIDHFFNSYSSVESEVTSVTISQMMEKVQDAKNRNPETYTRVNVFDYVSPVIGKSNIPTNWTVLIYGVQGDNIDSIKDALVNYILANTTHTRAEWEAIFPDIFKRTEFVLLPRWDLFAIPDMAVESGLYSSILNPYDALSFPTRNISFYLDSWMATDGVVLTIPFNYKGISIEVVRGPDNVEAANDFKSLFYDYVPVGTTSLDFNRISSYTQDWMLLVEKALIIAENFADYTVIPDPFRVLLRNNKTYLSFYYKNVNYLMALKGSYSSNVVPAA